MENRAFVITVSVILLTPVVMGLGCMALPTVFGQQPTTITPPNFVNPANLKLQEQKTWLLVEPPDGQVQQVNYNDANSLANMIIPIAISAGMTYFNKYKTDKDVKQVVVKTQDNANEILKGKEVSAEQNRVMFQLAPEDKVKAMEGTAPMIRNQTLQEDKQEYAEKIIKNKTPEPPKDG